MNLTAGSVHHPARRYIDLCTLGCKEVESFTSCLSKDRIDRQRAALMIQAAEPTKERFGGARNAKNDAEPAEKT